MQNPYPGPRPFTQKESEVFFGRKKETADICDLILLYPVVVLYAESGAGKTSLVHAGLIPLLKEHKFEVLGVGRVGGKLPPALSKEGSPENVYASNFVASCFETKLEAVNIHDLLTQPLSLLMGKEPERSLDSQGAIEDEGKVEKQPQVIVLDQLEELFYTYPGHWAQRRGFLSSLNDTILDGRTGLDRRLLLVIRQEYLPELETHSDVFPHLLRIRYHLQRLRKEQAKDAIIEPLLHEEYKVDDSAADPVIDELLKMQVQVRDKTETVTGEFVEPVQLQIVCQSLWPDFPREKGARITFSADQVSKVNKALESFYESVIEEVARRGKVGVGRLRKWFDEHMITAAGTRGTAYEGEGKLATNVLQLLEERHLIRAEYRAGAIWYELAHDRFIEPIRKSNYIWKRNRRRLYRTVVVLGYILIIIYFILSIVSSGSEKRQLEEKVRKEIASEQAEAFNDFSDGFKAREEGDLQVALKKFSSALRRYEALSESKNIPEGYAATIKKINSEKIADIHVQIAEILYGQADFTGAVSNLVKASRLEISDYTKSRLLTDLGLAYIRVSKFHDALTSFSGIGQLSGPGDLTELDPMEAVRVLDGGSQQTAPGFALAEIWKTRTELLKLMGPYLQSGKNLQLKDYICLHNFFVIGVSRRKKDVANALRIVRKDFPSAELGKPSEKSPEFVPIIIDLFIDCNETKKTFAKGQKKYRSRPVVGSWYPGCDFCEDLPRWEGYYPGTEAFGGSISW
jgi:tetratricopeptide (TPR) repeat protein